MLGCLQARPIGTLAVNPQTVSATVNTAAVSNMPSCSSRILTCSYKIVCKVKPAQGCCARKVKMGVPVGIVAIGISPGAPTAAETPPGLDWRPSVLPTQVRGITAAVLSQAMCSAQSDAW